MYSMQNQVQQLVRRFEQIAVERMQGMPFYNQNLQVEALGFEETEQGYLGVLITPWFINVVLIFREPPQHKASPGDRVSYKLVSGDHEFMTGEDEELGRYDFISLASPTGKYKSQQQAQTMARNKLNALRTPPGDEVADEQPLNFVAKSESNLSRRKFIMGKSTSG